MCDVAPTGSNTYATNSFTGGAVVLHIEYDIVPLNQSGSLLISNGYCTGYDLVQDASGSTISKVCNGWNTNIQIPFLKFAVDAVQMNILYSGGALLGLVLLFVITMRFVGWLLRLFTFRL